MKNQDFFSGEGSFRKTFDILLEGIQIIDFDWKYLYVNDALVNYSTYSKEQLLGNSILDLYPGVENTSLFAVLDRCMKEKVSDALESEFEFPDKSKGFFELSVQSIPQGVFILSINITERKTAESSLKRAEDNYRHIFDRSTDAIYIYNFSKGKLTDVNEKATEVTGFSREEILSGTYHPFINHSEFSKEAFYNHLNTVANGKDSVFEWSGKKKDGKVIWYEVNLKKAILGSELCIIVFFRDISKNKEYEEKINKLNEELEAKVAERTLQLKTHMQKLKESEEKFSKAFQVSAAGMAITRLADSRYVDVNDTFSNMIGIPKEAIIGRTSLELGIITDMEHREKILKQIREQGSARHFEVSMHHKSGTITHVLNSVETIWLNSEKYAIAIAYDITERKVTEEKLKKSDALFSNLFESNPAALSISRLRDGAILNVNESFLQLFEFSDKEEVIGNITKDLGILLDMKLRDEIIRLLKENSKVVNMEGNIRTNAGVTKWASCSVILTEHENEPCLLAVMLDMSERKKAQEELEEVNRELEAFSYSVSHDLRAPLRAANSYAQILMEDYSDKLDEEGRRIIKVITQNALKMGTLIDNLLSFSRLGKKEIKKREIDMNDLFNTVCHDISKLVSHKAHINIHHLHNVKGDYGLLYQVVYNLISNAVKYSSGKNRSVIEISSALEDNEIIYAVKDNGAGFDTQYKDKLFGVFQRLHSEEEFEGIGVGLAIVKRIVLKHHGRVWAESKLNEQTTFYFSLLKE